VKFNYNTLREFVAEFRGQTVVASSIGSRGGKLRPILLIVKVTFVITVFFSFFYVISTILVNKDDQSAKLRCAYHT